MTERSPPLRDAGEFGIAIERLEELIELARKRPRMVATSADWNTQACRWCPRLPSFHALSFRPAGREALSLFAGRFGTSRSEEPLPSPDPPAADPRDQTHLLLIDRLRIVDELFLQLDSSTRSRITRLVEEMAAGKIEFSGLFE